MRKTVIVLGSILGIVFLVFSFLGKDGSYGAEKDIYQLNRQYDAFSKDPKAYPDAQVQALLNGYGKFAEKHSDHKLAAFALTLRSRIYSQTGDYESAIAELENLIVRYEDESGLIVHSLVEMAQIHAIQGNKEAILTTYKRIVDGYPLSNEGLQAPLIVARHFLETKDTTMAARAYVDAIEHYQQLAKQYPDSHIEFRCQNLLGTAYIALQNWEKALEVFSGIIMKFANIEFWTKESLLRVTRSINTISTFELNDLDYAPELYRSFIDKYPDHPFNPDLKKMAEMMGEYKKYHLESQKAATAAGKGEVVAPTTPPQMPKMELEDDLTGASGLGDMLKEAQTTTGATP